MLSQRGQAHATVGRLRVSYSEEPTSTQSWWNHRSQESQAIPLQPHVTGWSHRPQGLKVVFGPGLRWTSPDSSMVMAAIEGFWWHRSSTVEMARRLVANTASIPPGFKGHGLGRLGGASLAGRSDHGVGGGGGRSLFTICNSRRARRIPLSMMVGH